MDAPGGHDDESEQERLMSNLESVRSARVWRRTGPFLEV